MRCVQRMPERQDPSTTPSTALRVRSAAASRPAGTCWTHLLREAVGSNELEALHLPEVGGVAQHVNVHELGDIAVTQADVALPEGLSKRSALLGDDIPLLSCCLACSHRPDQLPASVMQERSAGGALELSVLSRAWHRIRDLPEPYRHADKGPRRLLQAKRVP